jgi:hypothetical protein
MTPRYSLSDEREYALHREPPRGLLWEPTAAAGPTHYLRASDVRLVVRLANPVMAWVAYERQ